MVLNYALSIIFLLEDKQIDNFSQMSEGDLYDLLRLFGDFFNNQVTVLVYESVNKDLQVFQYDSSNHTVI